MHVPWVKPLQTSRALTKLVTLCRPDNTRSLEEAAVTLARYLKKKHSYI